MSDVSIKVNIAGKEYPLKVNASEQEDVLAIEREIKENIEQLRTNYGVNDKQDLLAMFLFQYMMANKTKEKTTFTEGDGVLHEKLEDLEDFVSTYLKTSI